MKFLAYSQERIKMPCVLMDNQLGDCMECKSPIEHKSNRLEELIGQLEKEYDDGCSESDFKKLKETIEKLGGLDEKLITIFHFIFFGKFEVIEKYNESFLSLLNNEPENIKEIIEEEIFSPEFKYGNHRKYCKKSYEYYREAIKSFLKLLPELKNDLKSDEPFDTLYKKISKKVYSFGRTATWDFLEIIDRKLLKGKLYPAKLYLRDSTGPKEGVLYFFGVDKINELKENLEEAGMDILSIILNSNINNKIKKDRFLIYKLEDALCNFQKGKY